MSIQEIKKALVGTFQGILKNIVSLANDSTLEKDFKVLKVGEKNTAIKLAENKTKISIILNNHYQWCLDNGRNVSWYKKQKKNTEKQI